MEIKKMEKSQVEITGEISADEFAAFWKKALENLSRSVKIDGFRPGHIPEDILIKNVGDGAVLDAAAELALQNAYPKIVSENKIAAIGRPMITITKIAKGNPLGFKIVTAILPEISLPDYKKIAKKVFDEAAKVPITVTDKDVDDLIEELRRARIDKNKPDELPAFDNEFAKSLGGFESVDDFRAKMRENLKLEKETRHKETTRMKAVEDIDKESQMELPDILVDNEINRGVARMKDEVEAEGIDFAEYLKNIKKDLEEIKRESRGRAEKSLRFNLILKDIARREKITVPEEEVNKEAEQLVKMYEGADLDSAKHYVEDILINSRVLQFLEGDIQSS